MNIDDRLFSLLLGARSEPPPDPRTQAIERYMQEQGDQSRLPWYKPENIIPRTDFNEMRMPDVSMSPNEEETLQGDIDQEFKHLEMMDDLSKFLDEALKRQDR